MARNTLLMDLVIFSVAAAIFYFVVWKNPKFQEWLKAPFGGVTPGAPGGTGTPAGGVIQDVQMIYAATGQPMVFEERPSGGNTDRAQWANSHECLLNEEATVYITISAVADEGEEVSFKLRGSCHGCNSNDCGSCYILGLGYNGSINCQYERPHPNNEPYPEHEQAGVASIVGRSVGIKAIVYNTGASDTLELWVDDGGIVNGKPANQWKNLVKKDVSEFAGKCNADGCEGGPLTFIRCDGLSNPYENAKISHAFSVAIDPAAKGAPVAPAPPVGAGTPTTPTPTTPTDTEDTEDTKANLAHAQAFYGGLYNQPSRRKTVRKCDRKGKGYKHMNRAYYAMLNQYYPNRFDVNPQTPTRIRVSNLLR